MRSQKNSHRRRKTVCQNFGKGERIQKEWYADGVYYRETVLNGETFLSQYDFKQRESASEEKVENRAPKKRAKRQRKSA